MTAFFKYQRLTLLWALFIFIICNANLSSVGKSHLFFPGFDKLVHCGLFFVLVVFAGNGYLRQQIHYRLSYNGALVITLVAVLFGGIIELLQLTVFTWRSAEWNDLFADTIGACMGIFSILVTINTAKYVKE